MSSTTRIVRPVIVLTKAAFLLDHVISVSLVFEAQIVCTLSQLVTERKYSFKLGKMHLLMVISVVL